LWAERYDRSAEGVFAVQDEITDAVTRAILPAMANAEQTRRNLGHWGHGNLINAGCGTWRNSTQKPF
jgi:hypothetical protein